MNKSPKLHYDALYLRGSQAWVHGSCFVTAINFPIGTPSFCFHCIQSAKVLSAYLMISAMCSSVRETGWGETPSSSLFILFWGCPSTLMSYKVQSVQQKLQASSSTLVTGASEQSTPLITASNFLQCKHLLLKPEKIPFFPKRKKS